MPTLDHTPTSDLPQTQASQFDLPELRVSPEQYSLPALLIASIAREWEVRLGDRIQFAPDPNVAWLFQHKAGVILNLCAQNMTNRQSDELGMHLRRLARGRSDYILDVGNLYDPARGKDRISISLANNTPEVFATDFANALFPGLLSSRMDQLLGGSNNDSEPTRVPPSEES